ncbi:hypothetical protein [Flavicella sediminum]|uniref:hypothetical protein n=1 Tax=Flavicella sediminum TaxID=2585141 RepID=UPI001122125F|nr:hypothetical protein [Flavicella sediminum]
MKNIVAVFVFVLSFSFCNAQKIEMTKVFGGYKYSQNGSNLSMKNLVTAMESNAQAFELVKKAKSKSIWSNILGGAGGFLVGYPIGGAIAGGDANWTMAGIGAGLIAIALPINSKVVKKTNEAISMYNNSLEATSSINFQPKFNLVANEKGFGLSMSF